MYAAESVASAVHATATHAAVHHSESASGVCTSESVGLHAGQSELHVDPGDDSADAGNDASGYGSSRRCSATGDPTQHGNQSIGAVSAVATSAMHAAESASAVVRESDPGALSADTFSAAVSAADALSAAVSADARSGVVSADALSTLVPADALSGDVSSDAFPAVLPADALPAPVSADTGPALVPADTGSTLVSAQCAYPVSANAATLVSGEPAAPGVHHRDHPDAATQLHDCGEPAATVRGKSAASVPTTGESGGALHEHPDDGADYIGADDRSTWWWRDRRRAARVLRRDAVHLDAGRRLLASTRR